MRFPGREFGLAVVTLAAGTAAMAGSFAVNPVRIDLSARQPVTVVTVHNDGAEPSVVQLEAVSWSQSATDDLYTRTSELLATPPIFTLAPGQSQVVRIGLRRPPDGQRELSYRLFLQEVPPAEQPDFKGMRMVLRIGVPVFVAAKATTRAELRWRAVAASDGGVKVVVTNDGTEHVKITDFQLRARGGDAASSVEKVATYVLPGQSHEWLVKTTTPVAAGAALRVTAHTDAHTELGADLLLDAT